MIRIALLLLLTSCASPLPGPDLVACLARMENHAASLKPVFAAMGYRFDVHLRLDEELTDGRGFSKSENVMGDASPGGAIRLRPSRLCGNDMLGRAVVAHEMAHVALQHRAVAGSGIIVLWEQRSPQEVEADQLAYAALRQAGGDSGAAALVSCWLGKCGSSGDPRGKPQRW
jgi:hypothetical protein